MSKRVEVLKDVPDADLARVKNQFKAAGARKITATLQDNGLWTLTAVFET
jgi:hypothetical protein